MKKMLISIIALVMIMPACSFADLPDLSGLSFDELVQLKEQINLVLWNSQEWQEVRVPKGIYEIGVDIPEGYWTLTAHSRDSESYIYCDQLDETKATFGPDCDIWENYWVNSARELNKDWKDPNALHELSLDMKAGRFIIIPCETTFTPYTGKPDLGFK